MEQTAQAVRKTCAPAIVSMVLSLLIFIPLTGLTALIVGIIALTEIAKDNTLDGKGMAITGVVVGGVRVVLMMLFVISLLLSSVSTREGAMQTKSASDLRLIGVALYEHARNNDGMLPNELSELCEQDYLTGEFLSDKESDITYHTPGENLYDMSSEEIIVTDDTYGTVLYADGSVDYLEE